MKLQSIHRQINCMAKQAGLLPTSWFANNSLSYDRTPEISKGSTGSDV